MGVVARVAARVAASRMFPSRRRASSWRQPIAGGRLRAWTSPARPCCSAAPRAASGGRSPGTLAGRGAKLVLSSRKQEALDELAAVAAGRRPPRDRRRSRRGGRGRAPRRRGGRGRRAGRQRRAARLGPLEDFSQEEIGRALRVNLEAPIRMTRELLPAWRERGAGHLVFVSSLSGKAASPRSSLYSATQVRAARLRARPARRPSPHRGRRLGRAARASSATPGCSPTAAPSRRRASAPARPRRSPTGVVARDRARPGRGRGRAAEAAVPARTSRLGAPSSRPGWPAATPARRPTSSPAARPTSAEPRRSGRRRAESAILRAWQTRAATASEPATPSRSAGASTRSTASTRCRRSSTSPACPTR